MTVETRTIIDVGDLIAIEIECPTCHQRIVQKLTDQNNFPAQCSALLCREVFYTPNSREFEEMRKALDTLGKYAIGKKNPMLLRFEIRSN
jgi:hypothetical protein